MKNLSIILSIVCIVFSLNTNAQIQENNYQIYATKTGKIATIDDIVKDMKNYDVLFFGEEHDDSVGHYLENKIYRDLFAEYGEKTALSLEMFDRELQTVMSEYLKDLIREKHFNADARLWNNYKDYKPMVEFSKENKLDVVCANSPRRYVNLVGRKGQQVLKELPKNAQQLFAPIPFDTASGKYYEKLADLFGYNNMTSHDTGAAKQSSAGMMASFNMVTSQSLWDATMAYSIAEYAKKNPKNKIFQINGRFHSDEHYGIVIQLKKYSPKTKPLVISSFSDVSFPNIDWEKYKTQADYILVTDPSIPKTF